MPTSESLLDLLDARSGIVCAVGAGGKKSLLQWLATHHPGRVALTASVFTTYFQERLGLEVVVDADERLLPRIRELGTHRSVAYACPTDTVGRRAGVSPGTIERIHRECGFDASFVKADGARMRLVKAPDVDEPVIPPACASVVTIISARAIGQTLSPAVAHRMDRCATVAGMQSGKTVTPSQLGRLIASPEGLLKDTEGRRVSPVINMVDDEILETGACEAAEVALALSDRFDRVILTRLNRVEQPVVGIVHRAGTYQRWNSDEATAAHA